MNSKALLTIGKVTGVHGLGGNLKVWSFAESIATFATGNKVWLKAENKPEGVLYTILKSSVRKKGVLLTLEGVDTRDQAEDLTGYDILIDKDMLPALEDDTWYWQDLYGLEVFDQNRGFLGVIENIFPTGANDVLVVQNKETKEETLVPMNRHFVESVDIEAKIVKTMLPEE